MRIPLAAAMMMAATLSAPLPALAQNACPTRADLAQGIRITRDQSYMSSVLTQRGGKLIEERETRRDGGVQRIRSTYLHPLAVAQRQDSKSVLTLKYSRNTGALQRLDRSGTWRSDIQLLRGTKVVDKGEITLRYRGAGTQKVGSCSYPVWSVVETMTLENFGTTVNEKLYAPALGMVLAFYRLGADGKSRVQGFQPNRIAAE